MRLPIHLIDAGEHNPRQIPAPPAADIALQSSLQTLGMLEPILVRQGEAGRWQLLAGQRRLQAAKALNWADVPAADLSDMDSDPSMNHAAATAENLVRAPMHPVDVWRAVDGLCSQRDWSLEEAGAALGLSASVMVRMRYLARMSPEILMALSQSEVPPVAQLRSIAMASRDVQRDALRVATQHGKVSWNVVAATCSCRRIPMMFAIFGLAALPWQEDWLAEPDDPLRMSTDDIDGFMDLQRTALAGLAAQSGGRMIMIADPGPEAREQPPAGWVLSSGEAPNRWRDEDPRRVFAFVVESGAHLGRVQRLIAEPVNEFPEVEPAKKRKPGWSRATRVALANLQHSALAARLYMGGKHGATTMLHVLLLALESQNLRRRYDIAPRLVGPDGMPLEADEDALCNLAAEVLTSLVAFDHPTEPASGPAAHWIADAIGATMPRCDTPEVLAGCDKAQLIALAQAHGLAWHGSAVELRQRLAGSMPAWRPVTFGAAGPAMAES